MAEAGEKSLGEIVKGQSYRPTTIFPIMLETTGLEVISHDDAAAENWLDVFTKQMLTDEYEVIREGSEKSEESKKSKKPEEAVILTGEAGQFLIDQMATYFDKNLKRDLDSGYSSVYRPSLFALSQSFNLKLLMTILLQRAGYKGVKLPYDTWTKDEETKKQVLQRWLVESVTSLYNKAESLEAIKQQFAIFEKKLTVDEYLRDYNPIDEFWHTIYTLRQWVTSAFGLTEMTSDERNLRIAHARSTISLRYKTLLTSVKPAHRETMHRLYFAFSNKKYPTAFNDAMEMIQKAKTVGVEKGVVGSILTTSMRAVRWVFKTVGLVSADEYDITKSLAPATTPLGKDIQQMYENSVPITRNGNTIMLRMIDQLVADADVYDTLQSSSTYDPEVGDVDKEFADHCRTEAIRVLDLLYRYQTGRIRKMFEGGEDLMQYLIGVQPTTNLYPELFEFKGSIKDQMRQHHKLQEVLGGVQIYAEEFEKGVVGNQFFFPFTDVDFTQEGAVWEIMKQVVPGEVGFWSGTPELPRVQDMTQSVVHRIFIDNIQYTTTSERLLEAIGDFIINHYGKILLGAGVLALTGYMVWQSYGEEIGAQVAQWGNTVVNTFNTLVYGPDIRMGPHMYRTEELKTVYEEMGQAGFTEWDPSELPDVGKDVEVSAPILEGAVDETMDAATAGVFGDMSLSGAKTARTAEEFIKRHMSSNISGNISSAAAIGADQEGGGGGEEGGVKKEFNLLWNHDGLEDLLKKKKMETFIPYLNEQVSLAKETQPDIHVLKQNVWNVVSKSLIEENTKLPKEKKEKDGKVLEEKTKKMLEQLKIDGSPIEKGKDYDIGYSIEFKEQVKRIGVPCYPKLDYRRHLVFLDRVTTQEYGHITEKERYKVVQERCRLCAKNLYDDMHNKPCPPGHVPVYGLFGYLYMVARIRGSMASRNLDETVPKGRQYKGKKQSYEQFARDYITGRMKSKELTSALAKVIFNGLFNRPAKMIATHNFNWSGEQKPKSYWNSLRKLDSRMEVVMNLVTDVKGRGDSDKPSNFRIAYFNYLDDIYQYNEAFKSFIDSDHSKVDAGFIKGQYEVLKNQVDKITKTFTEKIKSDGFNMLKKSTLDDDSKAKYEMIQLRRPDYVKFTVNTIRAAQEILALHVKIGEKKTIEIKDEELTINTTKVFELIRLKRELTILEREIEVLKGLVSEVNTKTFGSIVDAKKILIRFIDYIDFIVNDEKGRVNKLISDTIDVSGAKDAFTGSIGKLIETKKTNLQDKRKAYVKKTYEGGDDDDMSPIKRTIDAKKKYSEQRKTYKFTYTTDPIVSGYDTNVAKMKNLQEAYKEMMKKDQEAWKKENKEKIAAKIDPWAPDRVDQEEDGMSFFEPSISTIRIDHNNRQIFREKATEDKESALDEGFLRDLKYQIDVNAGNAIEMIDKEITKTREDVKRYEKLRKKEGDRITKLKARISELKDVTTKSDVQNQELENAKINVGIHTDSLNDWNDYLSVFEQELTELEKKKKEVEKEEGGEGEEEEKKKEAIQKLQDQIDKAADEFKSKKAQILTKVKEATKTVEEDSSTINQLEADIAKHNEAISDAMAAIESNAGLLKGELNFQKLFAQSISSQETFEYYRQYNTQRREIGEIGKKSDDIGEMSFASDDERNTKTEAIEQLNKKIDDRIEQINEIAARYKALGINVLDILELRSELEQLKEYEYKLGGDD